jgi:4-nitrophenyl phosphatase
MDGDGTLYAGRQPLPGAGEFIAAIQEAGVPYLLLTNNATRTPEQLAQGMAEIGLPMGAEHIFTSAQATATWLARHYALSSRILVVGEVGLRTELAGAGFPLVDDYRQADLVVAGLDRQATYARLAEATLAIRRGCPFIATNPDRSIPTERGIEPGAGAVLAFLEAASDVTPTLIGKPQPDFFLQALDRVGVAAGETVMIGDRYETDILGGYRTGMCTAAVLTGVTTAEAFARANPPATWVFRDMAELLASWRAEVVAPQGA